jgi:hypothetical protein
LIGDWLDHSPWFLYPRLLLSFFNPGQGQVKYLQI